MYFKAVIAYDGSAFNGFAWQKNQPSVLGELQKAFMKVGIKGEIIGAGRTDKGVHATHQVVSFEVPYMKDTCADSLQEKASIESLRCLLNTKLTPHIFIRSLRRVHKNFHARFDACWRSYRFLLAQTLPTPFLSRYVSYEKIGDFTHFKRALELFVGVHNFSLFKKNGSPTKDDIREIYIARAYWYREFIVVYVRGSGFLRAQMRLMVGAASAHSRGELHLDSLFEQICAKKRHYAYPISAHGLYLCGVGYASV